MSKKHDARKNYSKINFFLKKYYLLLEFFYSKLNFFLIQADILSFDYTLYKIIRYVCMQQACRIFLSRCILS